MRSKTSLFLIEIVIMILIFSVSAAICLEIFAYSKTLSEESAALSEGSLLVQTAAESFKATGDIAEAGAIIGAEDSAGTYCVYYNKAMEPCDEPEASYILKIIQVIGDNEANVRLIRISNNADVISLFVKAVT